MTAYEKAAIIGYYRNGMTWEEIAEIMEIWPDYVKQTVREYLRQKEKDEFKEKHRHKLNS